ncbi:MAG: FIST C-terminal domain-containing protein [Acholeplasmatales bacterium]|jgi:hypothetical protein|nr:FIST C-terminal domain-containing protein [Acholeplasmatales bacterium]
MIKTLSAQTFEITDAEYAVLELLQKLDLENNLLKNSVGILSCHSDYLKEEVISLLSEKLPFRIAGATSCMNGTNEDFGSDALSLQVLTSDDVTFELAVTDDLTTLHEEKIISTYNELLSRHQTLPSLVLTFTPLMQLLAGDAIINSLKKVTSDKVPLFGTLSVDHTKTYETSQTILDGKGYFNSLVLVAFFGPVKTRFEIAAIKNKLVQKEKAVITDSINNLLVGVNGLSALKYLSSLGLTEEVLNEGLGVIPLIVNYDGENDEAARAVFALTPEGYAVCGGEMPINTTIQVGTIDLDDVIETSSNALDKIGGDHALVIGYSCMARYLVLGTSLNTEYNLLKSKISAKTPFLFSYAGGEVTSTVVDNKYNNHVHNYSLILLVIE